MACTLKPDECYRSKSSEDKRRMLEVAEDAGVRVLIDKSDWKSFPFLFHGSTGIDATSYSCGRKELSREEFIAKLRGEKMTYYYVTDSLEELRLLYRVAYSMGLPIIEHAAPGERVFKYCVHAANDRGGWMSCRAIPENGKEVASLKEMIRHLVTGEDVETKKRWGSWKVGCSQVKWSEYGELLVKMNDNCWFVSSDMIKAIIAQGVERGFIEIW